MTKLKSKKMTKSTFAIIIMAIVMVAMLAFGGAYAYFTATASTDSKTFTTGYVKLSNGTALADITVTNVMPKQELVAANALKLTVDTTETAGNYIAVKFTFKVVKDDETKTEITDPTELAKFGLSADSICAVDGTNGWKKTDVAGVYIFGSDANTAVAQTGEVIINTTAFVFNASDNWTQGQDHSDNGLMNATVTITLDARSIQSTNVTGATAVTELKAMFNPTTAD